MSPAPESSLPDLLRSSALGSPLTEHEIQALDAAHLWHPYASADGVGTLPVVSSGSGAELTLSSGEVVIDAMASWWSAIHGYRVPELDSALQIQSEKISHVMFGGLTHEPAVRLASKLIQLAPEPLSKVFFADSGSVAMEVALKMALQRQIALGCPERNKLLTWRGGYHGDTFGVMSVCDPEGGMHHLFSGSMVQQVFVDAPPTGIDQPLQPAYVEHLRAAVTEHSSEIAGIVVEPIVQNAGGIRIHNPGYLAELRRLCDEHGISLIFDEIATGFGRTGKLFACEWAEVVPDLLVLGKALTGGYMTMAAVLCSDQTASEISSGPAGVLMHGPTFMANPLAASVASASIDRLLATNWQYEVGRIESALQRGLSDASVLDGVVDVRVLGAIGAIQLDREVDVARACALAVKNGVWLRPFRDLIYTMPPYVCTDEQISSIATVMVTVACDQL